MRKIVGLVLCLVVIILEVGCSMDYETKSRQDFHNDFVMDIKNTLPCTQLCNTKKFFKGDECYMYELTATEVKTFLDRIDTSWNEAPFDYKTKEKIYTTKNDDGKTLSEIANIPIVNSGYWIAKTDKGMTKDFELDQNFSLAILDSKSLKLYYFKRKV